MNNFSKIVIVILIIMTFFFIKEKAGFNLDEIFSSFKPFKSTTAQQPVRNSQSIENQQTQVSQTGEKETAFVYFLALDSNDNGIYKKVQREVPAGEDKLEFAIKELIKGPNLIEKSTGAYSEVPNTTKLLGIKQSQNKVIIDFSSDFQYGGGTDSVYSRMMQLIKTALINTENKKIYLYLDGNQVNVIGGEGIMITQPLTEKSLEV